MGFKCLHSGKCCTLKYVQINLSYGDIKRITEALNKSIKELFDEKIIGFNPFFDLEKNSFDIEIGLNKPCLLHKELRCSIHKARPLNCRIFPYYLIASFPDLTRVFDESYECVLKAKVSDAEKEKYKAYAKAIGDILLKESAKTEEIFKKIGLNKSYLLMDHFVELNQFFMKRKPETDQEAENLRIEFFKELISKEDFSLIIDKLIKEIADLSFVSVKELDEIEKILD